MVPHPDPVLGKLVLVFDLENPAKDFCLKFFRYYISGLSTHRSCFNFLCVVAHLTSLDKHISLLGFFVFVQ